MAKIEKLKNPIYLRARKGSKVYFIIDSLDTIQERLEIKTSDNDMIPDCIKDRWKFDSVDKITREQYHAGISRVTDSGYKVRYF